jgi:formate dehydrogenase major subunit
MKHQDKFDLTSTIGLSDPVKGEYYGLPWPCWGTAELKHPGTPLLYDTSKPVAQGGLTFRAAWGTEHDGVRLLAENSATAGSSIQDGYPEISYAMLDKLGWAGELKPEELQSIIDVARRTVAASMPDDKSRKHTGESNTLAPPQNRTPDGAPRDGQPQQPGRESQASGGPESKASPGGGAAEQSQAARPPIPPDLAEHVAKVNWKTDLSGGIQRVAIAHGLSPFGNGKARCLVWNYPDPVPKHREPLYTARRDLLPKYATYADRRLWRLPQLYASIQARDVSRAFPLILTSGRLVEFEGGGDETRANKWLAELQQQMFAEINPQDAARIGVHDGQMIWVLTPEGARVRVNALVTRRVGAGTVFMPFHFAGWWMGQDISGKYPEGTVPYVVGESANTATTYGYDAVTAMQETKTTLCQIEKA